MVSKNRIAYKINDNFHDIIYTKNILKSLDAKIHELEMRHFPEIVQQILLTLRYIIYFQKL